MVLASRKAVAIQENIVPRSSASEIVGSAVFVTLPSSAERRRGIHIAMKDRQKPGPRVHFWVGGMGAVEEGRAGCGCEFLGCSRSGSESWQRIPSSGDKSRGDLELGLEGFDWNDSDRVANVVGHRTKCARMGSVTLL
jgi:hypothetical protein